MLFKALVLVIVVAAAKAKKDESVLAQRLFKRAALKAEFMWPDGVVFYSFNRNVDNAGRTRVRDAMKHIEDRTCIRFQQRRREPNYVSIQYDYDKGACNSRVGFVGGVQFLNIANPEAVRGGYCILGGVIHELGHALGFFHEQSRPDRGKFVKINLNNLLPKYQWAKSNFDKVDERWIDYRGQAYDYGSLMHYPKYAFGSHRRGPVIEPLDRNAHIGQREGLSRTDIRQLNIMYNCLKPERMEMGRKRTCRICQRLSSLEC